MPENKHLKILLIAAYLGIGYFVFAKLGSRIWEIFSPFILAFIMAAATTPLVKLLRKKLKLPNWLATGVSLISIWVAILGILYIVVSKIISQLIQFFSQMPTIINKASITLKVVNLKWARFSQTINPEWVRYVNDAISKINTMLVSLVEPATQITINYATNIATSLPSIFVFTVAFILSCIFMTKDYDKLKKFIINQFSPDVQSRIREVRQCALTALKNYFRGMGVIMFITFCEIFIGLLYLNVKYAFSIALLTSLVDILPVFGTGTVLIPWAIISLLSGKYKMAIGLAVIYGVISVIRQFIEPKVMSKSMGTYPLVSLMSIYIGLKLFGVVGMILGPVISVVIIYLNDSGVIHLWKNVPKEAKVKKIKEKTDTTASE